MLQWRYWGCVPWIMEVMHAIIYGPSGRMVLDYMFGSLLVYGCTRTKVIRGISQLWLWGFPRMLLGGSPHCRFEGSSLFHWGSPLCTCWGYPRLFLSWGISSLAFLIAPLFHSFVCFCPLYACLVCCSSGCQLSCSSGCERSSVVVLIVNHLVSGTSAFWLNGGRHVIDDIIPCLVARFASEKLHVPISQSFVGAVILFDNGRVLLLPLVITNSVTVQTIKTSVVQVSVTQYASAAWSEVSK